MPTYNEAENLRELLPKIFREAESISTHELHLLIVDDKSPDGTAAVVAEWISKDSRIHLLTGEKKGLGEAYQRGFAHAIETIEPDLIIQMDADQQHDPALLPLFVNLAEHGFTLVIGSRFSPGAAKASLSFRRRLLSGVATFLVRAAAGLPRLNDCTSGYRCISVEILKRCNLRGLSTKGYSFQSSLLSELFRNGARVVEIPIDFGPRAHGTSKLQMSDQFEFLANIGRLWIRRVRGFAP